MEGLISGLGGGWVGLDGELGALVLWSLHTPLPPQLSQSLFERQGLPGPEKLPGSLRKGIPRTKSVGTAGLGAAWGSAVSGPELSPCHTELLCLPFLLDL